MARGTVKWFSDQKGYGFITAEGGEVSDDSEVFVHFSAIEASGFRTLHPGEKVEYELKSGSPRGIEAAHVNKV